MCGIYGQYNFTYDKPIVQQELREATRTLTHRGPDDEGYYVERGLGLGFRRLSIIDLSGGHQPMSDVDETVWVVFNGEIYNFAPSCKPRGTSSAPAPTPRSSSTLTRSGVTIS